MNDITHDDFLGGRLTLVQPKSGYRAGIDPVLLAASCQALPGQSVLDLGCGVGTAGLCLASRVPGIRLYGLEVWQEHADLARQNADACGKEFHIWQSDLRSPPDDLKALRFDHILANPPFFKDGTDASDNGRAIGRSGDAALADWVRFASKRLKPKGHFLVVLRTDRLDELLANMHGILGSIIVQPLVARTGRAPKLCLVRATKGGRGVFKMNAAIALHQGETHNPGNAGYAPEIADILRDGAAFHAFP